MMAVQEAGLVPDIDMLAAAMDACSKARDTEGAMHFMDQAIRLGLEPDDNMFREVRSFSNPCVRGSSRACIFLIQIAWFAMCSLARWFCALERDNKTDL